MSVQEIYEAACFQDIGGRKEQQDRVEILWSDTACLVVLADGMGGHMRGAFAAQTAVDVARKVFGSAVQTPAADLFESIVATANDHINSKATMFNCPATTCVLLHLTPLNGKLDAPGRQPPLPLPGWPVFRPDGGSQQHGIGPKGRGPFRR